MTKDISSFLCIITTTTTATIAAANAVCVCRGDIYVYYFVTTPWYGVVGLNDGNVHGRKYFFHKGIVNYGRDVTTWSLGKSS